MLVSISSLCSCRIVLLMVSVMVVMCFQGLLGAVGAVSVSNGYRWSAGSVHRMSSDPTCNPLRA